MYTTLETIPQGNGPRKRCARPVTNRVGDERKESFTFFSETTPANLSVAKMGYGNAVSRK